MYTAPLLALGLASLLIYRSFVKWLEKKWHKKRHALLSTTSDESAGMDHQNGPLARLLLLVFHYYTPLYVVLAYLTYLELVDAVALLQRTDWLQPQKLYDAFKDEPNMPTWWANELQTMLYGGGWLRYLSLAAPFAVVLTFCVTLLNTLRQVYTVHCKRGGINAHPGHDSAILVIGLPLIYSLMSFKSVHRMWMICANAKGGPLADIVDFEGNHSWLGRLVMCQLMYKTNFMVADVYEVMALFQFTWLTLSVLGAHRVKFKGTDQETSQKGIEALTMQGIYWFMISCLIEAIYYLFTTSVEFFVGAAALHFTMKVWRMKEQTEFFFLGMGTIASSAAIGNVVTVELTFHELLEEFRPGPKFWSTKILVSIAFLQSLALYLPGLNQLSVTEGNLFYASLLCLECFGVSLLHWKAWNPDEIWYKTLVDYLRDKEDNAKCEH
mmetsp:Transcript_30403/g.65476  ORF Transcript_30403/g.65476 Transcript_30403/m.65476 type:complete len:439 (-) Transcript_30403:147-1463(-)|eukprot:CAMPEP_0206427740 /NCGR_PEP_ID=MMETSP0324_2-20121206/5224_1 /ASSEMBLY_ACC=CAM_ASM_000836 /TAXON_ID=2866 /ORGANISM="Crypthecodinium cohnii, Strain Seligo" /LENGTH=438 /DNA_ID=CAMNT_0053893085 /DNA_START=104 /DNA_END=1420 /DNA_ORIENTATION=+